MAGGEPADPLKPLYDHATLIRGLARCRHEPAPRLLIIGDGPEREPLERLAGELGLAERVVFTGRIDNKLLPAWLAQAEIWVSGAHSDGLPLSMLEAMASGLKVVLAELPMTRDWHVPGVSWTFPIGDADGCARSFEEALQAPSIPAQEEGSGRAVVLQRGSLNATLDGFERICSELVDAQVSGGPQSETR